MTPSPKGFRFSVTKAGFRKADRPDLALVVSDVPAVAAGFFTTNLFPAAPVLVGRELLAASDTARGVLINSGQANACTGELGMMNCRKTLELVALHTDFRPDQILPASTGVIGAQLHMDKWEKAVQGLVSGLGTASVKDFAMAIMTTDAFPKFSGLTVRLSGGEVTLAGVAKGAGMICPDMATMLSVLTCDARVEADAWKEMVGTAVKLSFNRATVDGDTSTNDTLYALANGASGVGIADAKDREILQKAITEVLVRLAYLLVRDGEGATKVIFVHVSGAASVDDAEKMARTIGHSPLVKTAMYGKDANWGRIVAAAGRAGVSFNPMELRVKMAGVELFTRGEPTDLDFDTLLKEPLEETDIHLDIEIGTGPGEYTLMASDFGHGYIDINADYRT